MFGAHRILNILGYTYTKLVLQRSAQLMLPESSMAKARTASDACKRATFANMLLRGLWTTLRSLHYCSRRVARPSGRLPPRYPTGH